MDNQLDNPRKWRRMPATNLFRRQIILPTARRNIR
jgi:hypothetical protein